MKLKTSRHLQQPALTMLTLMAGLSASPATAQMRLGTPETIAAITKGTGDLDEGCGLTADYQFPDMKLRVEILGWKSSGGVMFSIKTYAPLSVTVSMRDIWFKTTTYFTLGLFKHGKPNAKGFLESRGELDKAGARVLFDEMARGGGEISFVFDGPLPQSRVPVKLPEPLPPDVRDSLTSCSEQLLALKP